MDTRALLIALNAETALSRPALYRLAEEPEIWCGADEPPPVLAARLGVPCAQMQRAQAAAAEAPARARREEEEARRLGATLVTRGEPAYPERLHHLPLPPPVLAVRGTLPEGPAVAIVGSRRADAYGREVAELFAVQLAAAGVAVVSGFARGIDATAHRGALAAPTGTTVAVLGCGLGVDYPAGHRALGDEIARCGAVVSELPCGATPRAWYFPARNRVIAALAHGTLVVQATLRSGSLITARHANDLGRDVYAVPGRIFDERSLGTNALIRDGAQLVQHPQDVLDALAAPAVAAPPPPRLEPEPPDGLAGDVLARLSRGTEQTAEELARILGCEVDGVLAALLELELAGLLVRRPGSTYTRRI